MNRVELIEKLDKATDRAADLAIQRGMPISSNKSSMWVGSTLVKKNTNGFYDIFSLDKKVLFKDIAVFDIATIIAQRYSSGEFKTIETILVLENKYSKYHTDMLHYLHCMKGAKKRHDYDTMAILEDKFQITEIRAKNTRDNISIFKRVK